MPVYDHLGNEFKNTTEMCKCYNVALSAFKMRIAEGWSLEKALTNPDNACENKKDNHRGNKGKECTDHLGNKYKSLKDMAKAYGKTPQLIYNRLTLGWGIEKALMTPADRGITSGKGCMDHLGNKYKSLAEMAKAYGKRRDLVEHRLEDGWSVERALTTAVTDCGGAGKECTDHLGNKYTSIVEMAKAYGKDYCTVHNRLKGGWTLEDALTIDVNKKRRTGGKECVDPLGNRFKSITEMAKAYGKDYKVLRDRLKAGWSLEDALILDIEISNKGKGYIDHKGNKFKSVMEMAKAYGKDANTVYSRLRDGWSIEDALTTDANSRYKECIDHKGNKFKSIAEMARAYGKEPGIVNYRLQRGWSIEDALTA